MGVAQGGLQHLQRCTTRLGIALLQILQQGNHLLAPELFVAPTPEAVIVLVKLRPELIADGSGLESVAGNQVFAVATTEQAGRPQHGAGIEFAEGDQTTTIVSHEARPPLQKDQHPAGDHAVIYQLLAEIEREQFNAITQSLL